MARRATRASGEAASATEQRQIRCAVYTRKSTEEGLEQEFNSLDAQGEACTAYIASQRHEGWTRVKGSYDDGGYSGGNMERPGLKRLLADVATGKVDVIVVYKVDRLTRSLADFARIVDVLDARGASFVSVTQSLNTTTSMGRLTLNVLLSFAQFEREVTGERIRDKIAASKKKGLWMGGPVPLGYRVDARKLVIDEAQAATVRHIFSRYAALGSGRALIEELRADGYRSRQRVMGERTIGGVPFQRGMLFAMLANPIYAGQIAHQGEVHEGEHQAIIAPELWQAVQQQIEASRVERHSPDNVRHPSMLAGILTDPLGRGMTPSHTRKGGKRYRYYVTHASELREGAPAAHRLPAADMEEAVVQNLCDWLTNARRVRQALAAQDAAIVAAAIAAAERAAQMIQTSYGRRAIVTGLVERVRLDDGAIRVWLHRPALAARLGAAIASEADLQLISVAIKMRQGQATKLVLVDATDRDRSVDDRLVRLLAEARAAHRLLTATSEQSIEQVASANQQCRKRFARLLRLAWLAPTIVADICEGKHPRTLTPRVLLETNLPLDWVAQRELFGFA